MPTIRTITAKIQVAHIAIIWATVFMLSFSKIYAQYDNFWAWGFHKGLNFNTSTPQSNYTRINDISSCFCDSTGKLLFYSTIDTIWDRRNIPMPSQPLYKKRPNSGLLSMISIPKNDHEYYVFYPGYQYGKNYPFVNKFFIDSAGLFYSIVDMKLNNGFGGIEPNADKVKLADSMFTGIGAVRKSNGGFWLLTRLKDTFSSYPVDGSGIGIPVKSVWPEAQATFGTYTINPSNNNTFIVTTCVYGDNRPLSWGSNVYGYQFDPATGKFAKQVHIFSDKQTSQNNNVNYYSHCAFSPNDSLFYVTHSYSLSNENKYLIQCNRFASDIAKSAIKLYISDSFANITDIKLAPNGIVYLLNQSSSYLGIIRHPDKTGIACDLNLKGFYSKCINNWSACNYGIFPKTISTYLPLKFTAVNICGKMAFSVTDIKKFKEFKFWFFDAKGVATDSTTGPRVSHAYKVSGKYNVIMSGTTRTGYTKWYSDSIYYVAQPKAYFGLASDTVCENKEIPFSNISTTDSSLNNHYPKWQWDFGDDSISKVKNPYHAYAKEGLLHITLLIDNGFCTDTFTKKIWVANAPKPAFTATPVAGYNPLAVRITNMLAGPVKKSFFTLGRGLTDTSIDPITIYKVPGKYYITQYVVSFTGCFLKDSVSIIVFPSPEIFVPNAFSPNNDSINEYFSPTTIGIESFNMTVVNRWGEQVYSTSKTVHGQPSNNDIIGWNGRYRGGIAPEGIYFYIIAAQSATGEWLYKKGSIQLIR